jgi:rare lipoprotein A
VNAKQNIGVVAVTLLALAGCDSEGQRIFSMRDALKVEVSNEGTSTTVERDLEAPEVFSVTEPGLWDGRPSLGGVWVAHPDVKDPERVIIRNTGNGQFVIGALFRRERENPGPRLQVSSDAAAALGILAGAPTTLNVTALRKQDVQQTEPVTPEAPLDPVAVATSALDKPQQPAPVSSIAQPAPSAAPQPAAPQASNLKKPYIQVGIFSVQANANRTADKMRSAGLAVSVLQEAASGKTFWRVIIGPAMTSSERAVLLQTAKQQGFSDAYPVSR